MPRAHPHRVRPANPALLARPGTFLGPTLGWAGSFPLLALRSRARTPPLTLHELHASGCSSAPVPESAPATSRACAPFSPQSLAIQAPWVSLRRASGSRRPCPAASALCLPRGRRFSQPQDRFLPAGLGVARPDSAPSADPRAPGAASPLPTQATGRSAPSFPLASRSPGALALALSKASALPAGALRAPASPGSCQCGDCAGKHGDRGNDPHKPRPSNPCRSPHR